MPEAIVEITKVGAKGQGVGEDTEKNVFFVERALPGDRVRVEFEEGARRYRDARLLELVSPSPQRRDAACDHFLECGGCDWLNWEYAAQLEAKDSVVTHALGRLNVVPRGRLPIQAAQNQLGYRTRVQLRFDDGKIGFYRRQSHDLVDVKSCPVAVPAVNRFIAEVRNDLPVGRGKVEAGLWPDGSIRIDWNKEHAFSGFTQVNEEQNEFLRERVASYCRKEDRVLELFCGDGNLTASFRGIVTETIGVDGSSHAIERANARGGEGTVSFFRDLVDRNLLRRLPTEFVDQCSLVILDPPRQGVGFEVTQLVPKSVKRIVYVSCAPQQLARDAAILAAAGWALVEIQCIDMFPQTRHIESLAVFERSLVH
ncbi:MAG: class I SAM-dependent RNA methyltransferase [Deltaproteobacteria bacterium]|nr:class I SAM-dependent RNA methyltransferase [Deltaproteobacteria bacterium]MBI3294230.1 class I SAM-dependent RNA methyltransferase [Deltaproteobacteria bacterium]